MYASQRFKASNGEDGIEILSEFHKSMTNEFSFDLSSFYFSKWKRYEFYSVILKNSQILPLFFPFFFFFLLFSARLSSCIF